MLPHGKFHADTKDALGGALNNRLLNLIEFIPLRLRREVGLIGAVAFSAGSTDIPARRACSGWLSGTT